MRRRWLLVGLPALLFLLLPAALLLRQASGGQGCASCHEIASNFERWHVSTHRGIKCEACHDSQAMNNLGRLFTHVNDRAPDSPRLRQKDVREMVERCQGCHNQEFADWQSGPHGVNYQKIFLDQKQNRAFRPMDDCLRCHGAHFDGPIRDLIEPIDNRGPWRFLKLEMAKEPAIPCLACHQIHRQGDPLERGKERKERSRPSIGFLDRREGQHVPVELLPLPRMLEGERVVAVSTDQRQALCYQCHAPRAGFQVGTGDDRTPIGVHEGLSCLACHLKHGQSPRASCATCHPRMSNCGLDVETMDTTFKNKTSTHNVHTVKCADCHTKGVPAKKRAR